VIAIFGPTGVGKTAIAAELAQLLRADNREPVAVSADAIQVYHGLEVISGTPSSQQLEALEHRLIGVIPLEREFSVGEYAQLAHAEIDDLIDQGKTPIVVGGTGLYLRAALTELDLRPPPPAALRDEIEQQLAQVGSKGLHAQLSEQTGASVHPNDSKRIVRSLELERMGEQPHATSDQLWSNQLRRPTALFGFVADKQQLAERIEVRVDGMLDDGAVGEVESAIDLGISKTARKALGLKELAAYAAGDVERPEAVAEIKRRHLAYAKRQLTWMRKLAGVEVIDRTDLDDRAAARLVFDALP